VKAQLQLIIIIIIIIITLIIIIIIIIIIILHFQKFQAKIIPLFSPLVCIEG
jgi:hypothetical protein